MGVEAPGFVHGLDTEVKDMEGGGLGLRDGV